jgi:anti-sigma factor RsiW
MTESPHHFDETLISGYLDGELSQGDAQQVRIHLEDCAACRATADEMRTIKEATMDSRFQIPPDTQWDESPRGGTSRLLRNAGIIIGLAWLLGTIAYTVVELSDSQDIGGILLVGGFVLATALILASAFIDRRETKKTDRYRRVNK